MSRRKKDSRSACEAKTVHQGRPGGRPGAARWKQWGFRLLAAVGAPALLFALIESGLRLAGYGYSTAFLLPAMRDGRHVLLQNTRFGWRFFGRAMARVPAPCAIAQPKSPGTLRIFVFGESAAFGDPQPQFGLPRMLEAMLNLRYPGARFEVVNAAMTAINSHAILPIAHDCARADGDIWVIYMGNNEVVGPFGAGTVFGPQAPALPLIRASLALKATRTGQCLDSLRQAVQSAPPDKSEWAGMMMFRGHEVRADEPRMDTVYHHFAQNLADIIQAGRRCGAGIVVGTVAVNLRECAPFASANRPGLSEADRSRWAQLYELGTAAQNAGRLLEAADRFREAALIDDTHAELRFRQGQCAFALGQNDAAQQHFRAARDLDTLRFRCDSRLADLTRRGASGRESERVLLADAERAFAEQSPAGSPGEPFFYEHVHLTFEGNYLLAQALCPQIEKLLPPAMTARVPAAQPWPAEADCARRLAWSDWDRQAAWSEILARLNLPPFTAQCDHAAQLQRTRVTLEKLAPATQSAGISEARSICRTASAAEPDDPWLQAQLASLDQLSGDLSGAQAAARHEVELLPSDSQGWFQLGIILGRDQQYADAADAFRRAFDLDGQEVAALENLGHALEKLGLRTEAIREYRRAAAAKPRFGPAWLDLGLALEAEGRKAEAEDCYREALTNRIPRAPELATLARFCQNRGWREAAATNYADLIKLSPADAQWRIESGQNLAALGRHAEALGQYAEAVRLAPDSGAAHFRYGLELGRAGSAAEAVEQFGVAVRLVPGLLEARLNLGTALMNLGRNEEALAQFEEVLKESPAQPMATRALETLHARLAAEPAPHP